jgi:competence protein ComGF
VLKTPTLQPFLKMIEDNAEYAFMSQIHNTGCFMENGRIVATDAKNLIEIKSDKIKGIIDNLAELAMEKRQIPMYLARKMEKEGLGPTVSTSQSP